jgi:hypothetical protein
MNEIICIEPDEFNLNINNNSCNSTSDNSFQLKQTHNIFDNSNTERSNFTENKNRQNLHLSTYSGNPYGISKITYSEPFNSIKPLNQNNNRNNYINNQDNNTNTNNFNKFGNNNIIQQTSKLSNQNLFQNNGGRRRTNNLDISSSNNLDIGSSNNYITIN